MGSKSGNTGGRRLKKKKPKPITRSKLIAKIDALIFKKLKRDRGAKCEFCGATTGLGPFHILPKGAYPKLRFEEENLLVSCWFKCHFKWHHDFFYARDVIEPKIQDIVGEDYEEMLWVLNRKYTSIKTHVLLEFYNCINTDLDNDWRGFCRQLGYWEDI